MHDAARDFRLLKSSEKLFSNLPYLGSTHNISMVPLPVPHQKKMMSPLDLKTTGEL